MSAEKRINRKSAISQVILSARNQSVSRMCLGGIGGPMASSKEVPVSQKPNQVESQREVETVNQPESSQSAGSALAATSRWASGVVKGSPSQPRTETSRKTERRRDGQSARNQSVSGKCPSGHKYVGQWCSRRKSQLAGNQKSRKTALSQVTQSARNQSVSRKCHGGHT